MAVSLSCAGPMRLLDVAERQMGEVSAAREPLAEAMSTVEGVKQRQ